MTRAEAKALCLPKYDSGEPCDNGHESPRYVNNNRCVECDRIRAKDIYAAKAAAPDPVRPHRHAPPPSVAVSDCIQPIPMSRLMAGR